VKKSFDRSLADIMPDGTEGHIDHFLGIDDPNSNLIAICTVKGSLGTATARRLLLPAFFFETRGQVPFVKQEKRQEQVDMRYGSLVTDEVTYALPVGMTMEGAPQDSKVAWAGHAVFVVKTQSALGKLTVVDIVARGFALANPDDYQQLRGFYQKVAATDQQELVLDTATVAKGN
jgi:hypothetical protein